jgi:hypothetical protein
MNAIALFGIVAGKVNTLDLDVIEKVRTIGVFRHISRRPQRFVHCGRTLFW